MASLDRVDQGVQVLTGTPGAGSTQLAAAYARAKLAADWRLVAWINAGNTRNLLAGLAAVADAAGLSDGGSGSGAVDAGELVREWLEGDGDRCLLVFDDAEDPDVLRPYVPAGDARVLVTSTRRPSATLGPSVSVDVFNSHEALAFLAKRAGSRDAEGAAAVAAELGHLPVALAQAAAMIGGHRLPYQTYLDRLRATPVQRYLTGAETEAYPQRAAAAVQLSLEVVRTADRTGVCTRAMEIMAVLSAGGVSRELVHMAGQAGLLASTGNRLAAAQVDRALEWLSNRSLLTFSLDGQTIVMHRLVAQTVRNGLARRHRLAGVCWAVASVLEAHAVALAKSQDRPAVRGIPQQVTALLTSAAEVTEEADEEFVEILMRLRFMALYHLIELGDSLAQAVAVGEGLTADLEEWLGPDHPDTLNSRNSLAAAYLTAGRPTEAIPLFEQTLEVRERLLGPDHPDTLTSQNNLAAAYQDAGRPADAVRLYELSLAARERLLGADHLSTLNSRGNLATAYRDVGRADDAIPLFEQTLAGRERVLGPDHPDTWTSRENLATAYRDVGRAAEAIPLFEQTATGRDLPPDRPRTRSPRKNLGAAYRETEAISRVGRTPAADHRPPAGTAGFRRPPADPARRALPSGLRRPPADPARRVPRGDVVRPSVELADSAGRTPSSPPVDAEDDSRIAAALAAGDPTGVAMAYDRYAATLYGYCHWMLHDTAAATGAVQDTFVIAAVTLPELSEGSNLRPWLFALARNECRRRARTTPAKRNAEASAPDQHANGDQLTAVVGQPADVIMSSDVTMSFRAVDRLDDATNGVPADTTITFPAMDRLDDAIDRVPDDTTMTFHVVGRLDDAAKVSTDVTMPMRAIGRTAAATNGAASLDGDPGKAHLQTLIRSILADLRPREREVIELSFRHDLYDNDLATALGVSWGRAHALASRAHGRLEEAIGALHLAFTRRQTCAALRELLADRGGQLTKQTRDLVRWHIEECPSCTDHGRGTPRPEAFSRLLPLAPLPPELREQVLARCSATTEDALAYRRRVAQRAESARFAGLSQAIERVNWDSIRANPGVTTAAVAIALWVVAAVSITLFTFAGSHPARAAAARPTAGTSSGRPPAAAPASAGPASPDRVSAGSTSAGSASASSTSAASSSAGRQPAAYVPSPALQSPSPSPVLTPSRSPSPKPSKSPSPSRSPKPSKSASPSQTPSPSASGSSSPSPSPA